MALAHLECDLADFSRVDLDYWDMDVSAEVDGPTVEVGTNTAEGDGQGLATGRIDEVDAVVDSAA